MRSSSATASARRRQSARSARSPSPDEYLTELVARLRALAGTNLVGVYAGGSYALGAYEDGRSDLDVAAVLARPATRALKERIVAAVRHEVLPCPARGLELVVYSRSAVGRATAEAAFELNLNTGARMPFRVDFEPDAGETHWFAIDRSVLAAHGVALDGPPVADVFASLPRTTVLPLLARSLRWHIDGEARSDDAVLNACRALRYAEDRTWTSKRDAGLWAAAQDASTAAVASRALAARRGEATLEPDEVRAFLDTAIEFVSGTADRDT